MSTFDGHQSNGSNEVIDPYVAANDELAEQIRLLGRKRKNRFYELKANLADLQATYNSTKLEARASWCARGVEGASWSNRVATP